MIRSVIIESEKENFSTPSLLISKEDGLVVLAMSKDEENGTFEGVVVGLGTGKTFVDEEIGAYESMWTSSNFVKLKGKVTLENK